MDMEDDHVVLTDAKVDESTKGKEPLSNPSVGLSNSANLESCSYLHMSDDVASGLHDSSDVDDSSPNLFCGDDEWIDAYHDDILYDDAEILESYFDGMDVPPGVEAVLPWLPSSSKSDSKALTASISTNSSLQLQPGDINIDYGLKSSLPVKNVLLNSSRNSTTGIQSNAGTEHIAEKLHSDQLEEGLSQNILFTSLSTTSTEFSNSTKSHARLKEEAFQTVMEHLGFDLDIPTAGANELQDLSQSLLEPYSSPELIPFSSSSPDLANDLSIEASLPPRGQQRNVDEILQRYDVFKNFDILEDYSDHHYAGRGSSATQPAKHWAKRIQEEWKILENNLPDKIFVRVYESRMDLLRAVIIGAEETPYHDGLFFFDVFFPTSYPATPPEVHYRSLGLAINPNLYNNGKVCLSLLNTWQGSKTEKWVPGVSTMLQVLVSIQALILNANPYFNEPLHVELPGSAHDENSYVYNEMVYMSSMKTMLYNLRRPPMGFEDFVIGYFCTHAHHILLSCKAYLDGAQVGSVRGGIQEDDKSHKNCSEDLKMWLAASMPVLVNEFLQVGAKDCEEFLCFAEKKNEPEAGNPPSAPNNSATVDPPGSSNEPGTVDSPSVSD